MASSTIDHGSTIAPVEDPLEVTRKLIENVYRSGRHAHYPTSRKEKIEVCDKFNERLSEKWSEESERTLNECQRLLISDMTRLHCDKAEFDALMHNVGKVEVMLHEVKSLIQKAEHESQEAGVKYLPLVIDLIENIHASTRELKPMVTDYKRADVVAWTNKQQVYLKRVIAHITATGVEGINPTIITILALDLAIRLALKIDFPGSLGLPMLASLGVYDYIFKLSENIERLLHGSLHDTTLLNGLYSRRRDELKQFAPTTAAGNDIEHFRYLYAQLRLLGTIVKVTTLPTIASLGRGQILETLKKSRASDAMQNSRPVEFYQSISHLQRLEIKRLQCQEHPSEEMYHMANFILDYVTVLESETQKRRYVDFDLRSLQMGLQVYKGSLLTRDVIAARHEYRFHLRDSFQQLQPQFLGESEQKWLAKVIEMAIEVGVLEKGEIIE